MVLINSLPQFQIKDKGHVSRLFLQRQIQSFHTAAEKVKNLPYGRNTNSSDLSLVLTEHRGTCSTKHAILARLCEEQGIKDIQLVIGIYEMNDSNTKGVGTVLDKYGLHYIPEAHCYLKYNNKRFDFTNKQDEGEPIEIFLLEQVVKPNQVGSYKRNIHKNFLQQWIELQNKDSDMPLEQIWNIREECIEALSS
jgi:hypothetical protein